MNQDIFLKKKIPADIVCRNQGWDGITLLFSSFVLQSNFCFSPESLPLHRDYLVVVSGVVCRICQHKAEGVEPIGLALEELDQLGCLHQNCVGFTGLADGVRGCGLQNGHHASAEGLRFFFFSCTLFFPKLLILLNPGDVGGGCCGLFGVNAGIDGVAAHCVILLCTFCSISSSKPVCITNPNWERTRLANKFIKGYINYTIFT